MLEEARHVVDDGQDDDDDDLDASPTLQRRCAEFLDSSTDGVVSVDGDQHRQPDRDRVGDHCRRPDVDDVVERLVDGLQVPGVRVDGWQGVNGEGDEEQKGVADGHALQQKDGGGVGLVLATEDNERRDVADQSEHTERTDQRRAHDEVEQPARRVGR